MARQDAFDIAVRGCSGVVHVASVTSMSPDPNEVITPSIAGALNALEAAAKEPAVRRVVYCSSVAAAVSHDRGVRNEITSDSWNMLDFEDAWAPPPYERDRAMAVYASSKMQTEAAVWRWYAKKKPAFVLNTVLPDTLWGRVLDLRHQGFPSSVGVLKAIYDGTDFSFLPARWLTKSTGYSVDVQDSALLHVAALILPEVSGQRIFAASTPWNIQSLVQLLRGLYPHKNIGGEIPDLGVDQTVFTDAGKAEELLRRMGKQGWTDLETSVERTCESFF
ncbi:hypothetical protein LTR37_019188 [Vermiconidia calcicola]|uniref:Uncharacterized protein n=1 Tax=Vermiconidia calcicola TaxID=1690605 RepID=A0ACC3MHX2_9PEZI|nr:hypothetical protein LTR37_019188 [Vermiconidia calcicola]